MKKRFLTVALVSAVIASMSMSSCIGSFALTNKLLDWNRSVDNKFVNEVIFFAFLIVPVYEVATLADILVLNSIEFWSGSSPLAANSQIIEGNDAKYLVERDANGYTITNMTDQSQMRLDFSVEDQTWSVVGKSGEVYPLMTFVDADHIKVATGDGSMMLIEKSEQGLYAYQQAINHSIDLFASR